MEQQSQHAEVKQHVLAEGVHFSKACVETLCGRCLKLTVVLMG